MNINEIKTKVKERFNPEEHAKYWNGSSNKIIRYYFYTQKGLALLNEFRYLIMCILALYAILKLESWWIMPLMFIVTIPFLIFLGWLYVNKMAKVMEYLNIALSTHFSKYNILLQEEQLNVIKSINEKLNKGKKL